MAAGWSDRFLVGVKAIDEDHKGLFELVAAIEEHRLNGSRADYVAATVNALELYTAEHFEREERFMRRAKFPGFEGHRKVHEDFRALVRTLAAQQKADPSSIDLKKVTEFLNSWIGNHIKGMDMEYLPYVTGERSGDGSECLDGLRDFTVSAPCDKGDSISRFAAILREGGAVANALEEALDAHEKARQRKLENTARKLFSASE